MFINIYISFILKLIIFYKINIIKKNRQNKFKNKKRLN